LGLYGNGGKSANQTPAGYDTTFQAIIIPHTINAAAKPVLQFKTARRLYEWPLPANEPDVFEQGKVYTYNLILRGETVVGFTGQITPWDNVTGLPPQEGGQAASGDSYNRIVPGDKDTLAVRYIQATQFSMGTDNRTASGNWLAPAHSVELRHSYHITQTEITNAQYCKFLNDPANGILNASGQPVPMTSGGSFDVSALTGIAGATNVKLYETQNVNSVNYTIAWDATAKKWNPVAGRDSFPIAGVTWYGALAYAKWAGGSLPTEAQWENAARGKTATTFDYIDGTPNGAGMGTYAYTAQAASTPPQKVAQKQANTYGLYDIFGNVTEWCLDQVGSGSPTKETYTPPFDDPVATGGTYGIVRGGNCGDPFSFMFIGNRYAFPFASTYSNTGFRVAFTFN
jgi:formylglycine-generating enzyme required for sulfatase activity